MLPQSQAWGIEIAKAKTRERAACLKHLCVPLHEVRRFERILDLGAPGVTTQSIPEDHDPSSRICG